MAAGDHFLLKGFEGASMDAIADAAGVSKLTIYNHFKNKDVLFKEVIISECDKHEYNPELLQHLVKQSPKTALTAIARSFLGLVLEPKVVEMYRVIISEAAKRPKISQLFYEAGPERMIQGFAKLLQEFCKQKRLKIADPHRATHHFFLLVKGELHMRALLNIPPEPTKKERELHIRDVVNLFVKTYAP